MSIADQITALTVDKTAIENAITSRGQSLSENSGFDTFASDVETILDKSIEGTLENGASGNIVTNATKIKNGCFEENKTITSIVADNATRIGDSALRLAHYVTRASFRKATTIGATCLYQLGAYKYQEVKINVPKVTVINSNGFMQIGRLKKIFFANEVSMGSKCFSICTSLKTVILGYEDENHNGINLSYANAFNDNTPFASNHSGGIIYVPKNAVSWYESATNWSSLNCRYCPIEKESFTGDGTTTIFTLANNTNEVFGVKVGEDFPDYTFENGVITFAEAPEDDVAIIVYEDGTIKTTFSGDGTTTSFTYSQGKPSTVYYVKIGSTIYPVGSGFEVTYDDTTGMLTFTTAPASGTDNIEVYSNEVTI